MPRIRFLEKEGEGFLILATRGPGYGYPDGTIFVSQTLLDTVKDRLEQAGVKYEVVNARRDQQNRKGISEGGTSGYP
ncbi:hypothetical protein HYR99_16765 [Candidatus Poribacteria bacterium]|nr:hypothetical protein [Candidatus Poribacteria bacterium]